jgi:hypothetical protein
MSSDVSEESVASTMRDDEYAKQESGMKGVMYGHLRLEFSALHGVISENTELLVSIAMITSNHTYFGFICKQ